MEFIRIEREYIATHEVHGLDAAADGLSCKLHYGNTHRVVHGEAAVDLIAWAQARLWNTPAPRPAESARVEIKTPLPDSRKVKREGL